MSALLERLNGRTVIASLSTGKDSVALSLWLTEQGIEHERWGMCETAPPDKEAPEEAPPDEEGEDKDKDGGS